MKKIITLLLFTLLTSLGFSQTLEQLQKKGDSLYNAKDFRNAAVIFFNAAKLIPENKPGNIFRMRLSASRSWVMVNLYDSAFTQLNRISNIKNLSYVDVVTLASDQTLIPLHQDARWAAITKKLFDSITKENHSPINSTYTQEEIIYGRKDGMALTMLRLKPKSKTNGKAIIQIRSGGWGSTFYMPNVAEAMPYLKNGYAVFIVFHGSEPVYTVPDVIEDIQRVVRFIRYNAKLYSIDPDKIGIMGSSAGGHLALMCGLSDSSSVATSPDPVDRLSSKVQAVAAFSPTIDFLNWDNEGNTAFSAFLFKQFLVHVLEFRKWDAQRRRFSYVTDSTEINIILKQISPAYHVSPNDAAIMVFHGNEDGLVPVRQAEVLEQKLRTANVPAAFHYKKDGEHGWPRTDEETQLVMNWFSKHLN